MTIGHYRNTPLTLTWVEKGNEDRSLIETQQVESPIDTIQETIIDKRNFTMRTESGIIIPLGMSDNAPAGKFSVLEKWENPYWKSENRFHYPSATNPMGQYLIILGDYETGEKIHQSIH